MQHGTQPNTQRNPERIHCKPEISPLICVVMFDSQFGHFILTPPEKTKFDHNIYWSGDCLSLLNEGKF